MDKKLLLDIFHIPAMSGNEKEMKEFIEDFLDSYNIPYEEDSMGNVYNLKNKNRPLLSAHMDTVQDTDDEKLCKFISIRGNILSGLGVIGGDDKNGIFIILEILKEIKDINFAFFVEEEIGTVGSSFLVNRLYKDFENIPYGLVLDRKGSSDIICEFNDYGTLKFEKALEKIGNDFNYIHASGLLSDADSLSEEISCANLSVGYYNAHTKSEYVKLDELETAFYFVKEIIETLDETFEAPTKVYSYTNYNKNKKSSYYSQFYNENYNEIYDDEKCSLCNSYNENIVYLSSQNKYVCYDCYEELTNCFSNSYTSNSRKSYDNMSDEEINYLLNEEYI